MIVAYSDAILAKTTSKVWLLATREIGPPARAFQAAGFTTER